MPKANQSKADAKANGLKVYSGVPCVYGHDGVRYVNGSSCVACASERQKSPESKSVRAKHYDKNKAKYIAKAAKSYEENRKAKIAYACELQKKRLPVIAEQRKHRAKTDVLFALNLRIRGLVKECLKNRGHRKNSRTVEILGCSIDDFKVHIERQFFNGMTWENRGEWEIDHITPVSTAKSEEEMIGLNHFTNMRPLWRAENRSKSAKVLFLI